ncbi:MAG: DUF4012 domain-containing protein [Patescibacteria group bacterium]|nr:DUF4012 domain-containing protein [Patescibacteria group bacterium]
MNLPFWRKNPKNQSLNRFGQGQVDLSISGQTGPQVVNLRETQNSQALPPAPSSADFYPSGFSFAKPLNHPRKGPAYQAPVFDQSSPPRPPAAIVFEKEKKKKRKTESKDKQEKSFYELYKSQITELKNHGFVSLSEPKVSKSEKTAQTKKSRSVRQRKILSRRPVRSSVSRPASAVSPFHADHGLFQNNNQSDNLDQAITRLIVEWQKKKTRIHSRISSIQGPVVPVNQPPVKTPTRLALVPPSQGQFTPSEASSFSPYAQKTWQVPITTQQPTGQTRITKPQEPARSRAQSFLKDYESHLNQIEKQRIRSSETILEKINRLQKNLESQAQKHKEFKKQSKPRPAASIKFSQKINLPAPAKTSIHREKTTLREIIREAFNPRIKKAFTYSSSVAVILAIIPVALVIFKGVRDQSMIKNLGTAAYGNLKQAQASIQDADIDKAGKNFDLAYKNFQQSRQKLDEVGGVTTKILNFVPGISKVESGRNLAKTGENISLAGKELTAAMSLVFDQKQDLKQAILNADAQSGSEISLTDMVFAMENRLKQANYYLEQSRQSAQKINPDDFPKEEQEKIIALKDALPSIIDSLNQFLKYTDIFQEILGQSNSRKYLILFQNNHEMRATGGFIGTYGVVKIDQGKIENLEIDGIYNPDGQLKERIIPPEPIQKMSAAWSMHDANWWPDFPTSAEKISWFYEKTGGPTVDGVISLTPKVIVDLLEVIGPIEVPGYGTDDSLTVTSENFMEQVQYQVEVDYDKQENRPKKILADLTPLILDKVFAAPPQDWSKILNIFSSALDARHLYLYSFDYQIQQLISDMGWSGEILNTSKDYLSVVNTNISGQKTDGVIKQDITHQAQVQKDGSVIDTVTVKRFHSGGNEEYEWHNAVNSDWMRIYVPQGSEFISASGFTREFVDPPLDYAKLDFKEDFQVKNMEQSYRLDEESATRIYDEKEKTVFANWVYTSPGETSIVTVKYLLPFRLDLKNSQKPADTYSLLAQKQGGDENSTINLKLAGLDDCEYVYQYPDDLKVTDKGWDISRDFNSDSFFALIVKKKN